MKTRRKKIGLWICLLTVLVWKPVYASAELPFGLHDWVIYEYNESNGLPTGEANTVLQTSDGYVWIGSYGGLIRYDGTTFLNYSKEEQLSSSSIRSLFEDSQGRLWIGTNDKGVYLYENNEFKPYSYENKKEFLSVRSFAEDKEGTIYVGTTSGLAKVEGEALVLVNEEVHGMTIYSMAVDENDVLWTCMDDGKAMLLSKDKVIFTFDSNVYLDAPLYCAGVDKEGGLYLGTSENLIYHLIFLNSDYGERSFSFEKYTIDTLSTVNDIKEDDKGNIWVAALNGVGYFDSEKRWNLVSAEHAAAANVIDFDYEGNVWIASTSYGIIHLVDGLYYNANDRAGLAETSINTVAVCGDKYYLGTDTGLLLLDSEFRPVENELTELLQGERIRNILCDSDGNIWIGTYYQHGLLLYEPEEESITAFTEEEGLSDSQIRMIMECSDGRIAVASQNGVSILQDHEVVRTYTEKDGLTYPAILCLCEDAEGTLYAGSDGQGFFAIQGDTVTQYGFDQGLDSGVVLRMLPDSDGAGLFISAGNSLYYWDYESFRLLDNYDKSPGSIFDMYLNGEELWLMQSNGINVLNRSQLLSGQETEVKVLGVSEGLTGTLNANTWNDAQGNVLYLCTGNGLSVLDMSDMEKEQVPIRSVINEVTVDDITYEMPKSITLDQNATRLTFYFAALSYSEQSVTVRYQLKGFDEEYHYLTNDQPLSASYTNLSGGDYEFVLEVLGEGDHTQTGTCNISIHKDYKLWEHTWFWILAGVLGFLLLLLIFFVFIQIKTRRLKQRQKEYQSIIAQALQTFANTIDAKDKYTNGHSIRVAAYALEIAKRLKLSKEEQERIYYIALLHDIGKIGISDEILNKPGKLTQEEREIIMSHPAIGGDILKDFTSLPGISEGARYHHERYDGQGYNEGLKGEEIPFFARIICVADSYDAMSSARCYRKSLDKESIMEELKRCSGTQFDPAIVKIMLEMIEEGVVPIQTEGTEISSFS